MQQSSVVRPLFPQCQRVSRCVWGRSPLLGPTSLHQLPRIPRARAALWRPVLLPESTCCPPAPEPAALLGAEAPCAHPRGAAACAGGGTAQRQGVGIADSG